MTDEQITVEEAKGEVESIIKELEDLRYVYLARPNFRTQKAYRDKLGEIMDRGIRMQQLWDEQNFIEPEYRDLVNSPENVFAVKLIVLLLGKYSDSEPSTLTASILIPCVSPKDFNTGQITRRKKPTGTN